MKKDIWGRLLWKLLQLFYRVHWSLPSCTRPRRLLIEATQQER